MAGYKEDPDNAMWEPIPWKLCEVVESETLPIVVKVLEGVYGGNEGSCFSNGDLIKLDSYVTIDKVKARKAGRPALNQVSEYQGEGLPFTVPLDYRGKVGLVPDLRVGEVVRVVNDLRQHGAKWVRVLQDVSYCHHGNEHMLNMGDMIKIVEFKGHVMSCTRGQVSLSVPSTVNGQFQVLRDCKEYSVRDVVERGNLPQVIHFLPVEEKNASDSIVTGLSNLGIFTGEVVLEELVREKIAVGHFKGSGEDSSRFARRSGIILPLHEPLVAELEVLCPHYSDDKDYEFFQMTHFSQTSDWRDLDLYMHFSKPGVRFIDYKGLGTRGRPSATAARPREDADSGSESDYEEPCPPVAARKTASTSGGTSRAPWQNRGSASYPCPDSHQNKNMCKGPTSAGSSLTLPAAGKPIASRRVSTGSHFTLAELGRTSSSEERTPGIIGATLRSGLKGLRKKFKQKFIHTSSPTSSTAPEVLKSPKSPNSLTNKFPDADDRDGDYDVIQEPTRGRGRRPTAEVRPQRQNLP